MEAAGGRVALTEIAAALNIDFDHINRTARSIIAKEESYIVSNGEIFAQ